MTKQVFKCIGNGHGTSREIHLEQVKGMQTVSTSRHRHCRHSDALAPFACFRWQAELIVRKGNSIEIDFSTVLETERERGRESGRDGTNGLGQRFCAAEISTYDAVRAIVKKF